MGGVSRSWGWRAPAQRLQWCIPSSPESFVHNIQKCQLLWKQLYEDYIHCLLIIRRLNHNLTSGIIIVVYLNSINSINTSRTSNTSKTSSTSTPLTSIYRILRRLLTLSPAFWI
jgi:hypothetical protein